MAKKISNKQKGNNYEKKVQKTIASGALWFAPTDLNFEDKAIEVKYTEKSGFRVSLELLEKLWDQALSINKEPFLVIGIKRNERQTFRLDCHVSLENK